MQLYFRGESRMAATIARLALLLASSVIEGAVLTRQTRLLRARASPDAVISGPALPAAANASTSALVVNETLVPNEVGGNFSSVGASKLLAPTRVVATTANLKSVSDSASGSKASASKKVAVNSTGVVLPVDLAVLGNQCGCHVVGLCTCGATVEFIECVADACASGACECKVTNFMHSCDSMTRVCPTIGLHCAQEKATCLHTPEPMRRSVPELRQELEQLRTRKCKLEKAIQAGFFNSRLRLQELLPEIQSLLDILKMKGEPEAVYMSCGSYPAGVHGQDWTISWTGGEALAMPKLTTPAMPATSKIVDPAPQVKEIPRIERSPVIDPDAVVRRPDYTSLIISSIILIIFAILYNRVRMRTMWENSKPDETGNEGFHFNLCGCCSDLKLSLFSWCCFAQRWADTMDKANQPNTPILQYWAGIVLMLAFLWIGGLVGHIAWLTLPLLAIFRQKLRLRYGITACTVKTVVEDILTWLCCPLCAVVQEARQVESSLAS